MKALSEGTEGQQQGSFSGSLAAQTKLRTESTRFQGPLGNRSTYDAGGCATAIQQFANESWQYVSFREVGGALGF